jgi:hypothetical protein
MGSVFIPFYVRIEMWYLKWGKWYVKIPEATGLWFHGHYLQVKHTYFSFHYSPYPVFRECVWYIVLMARRKAERYFCLYPCLPRWGNSWKGVGTEVWTSCYPHWFSQVFASVPITVLFEASLYAQTSRWAVCKLVPNRFGCFILFFS